MKEIKEGNIVLYREWIDIHRPPTWDTYIGLVIQKIYYDGNIPLYIVLIDGKLKHCYSSEIELFEYKENENGI